MAKRNNDEKLIWIAVNPESLPAEHRAAYDKLRKCFEATKKAKEAFEALTVGTVKGATSYPETHPLKGVSDSLKAGMSARFSYLRGIAMAVASPSKPRAERDGISLVA